VRLGQLIQKDIRKKEKSTTANRDPHLELNIAGKNLGEEGLKVVCGTAHFSDCGGTMDAHGRCAAFCDSVRCCQT